MQYVENHNFVEVQICHRQPQARDTAKWDILPLLETEAKVKTNDCLEGTFVVTSPLHGESILGTWGALFDVYLLMYMFGVWLL